jgi:hypothetical protein
VVENKLFGEASFEGKGEKLSHEVVVNSFQQFTSSIRSGRQAVPKWRFSASKVTRSLLTFTDKLTWYRQKNVLIFSQLGRSGDAPSPDTPVVRARSLSRGTTSGLQARSRLGSFLYKSHFLSAR